MDRAEALETILDHYQNPRNFGEMQAADISLQGGNPGCGDIVTLYLKFDGNTLEEVSFTGTGCTISQAATSMLTEVAKGYTIEQIENLDYSLIEDLLSAELVKTRPKCSTLGLDTLKIATNKFRQERSLK
jgi:nitrogen fixation protein NifU and related proteins